LADEPLSKPDRIAFMRICRAKKVRKANRRNS